MKELLAQLQSKKLRVLILSEIGLIISGMTGVNSWDKVIMEGIALAMAYMGAQGYADGASGGMTSSLPGTPTAEDLPSMSDQPKN